MLFKPLPRIRSEEWMDQPGVDPAELQAALRYIRRVNKYLGYNRATRSRLRRWATQWSPATPVRILDVATGSGDVPANLLAWSRGRFNLRFTGLDLHPITLHSARQPGVSLVQGDAMRLPFDDGSFDYVLTSMFLHHLSSEQVVLVLREMWRVARRGVLAADLLRTRGALAGIWLATRMSSAMIRHDAIASVRQAFTSAEIESLALEAGWVRLDLQKHPNHRFTLVADKPMLA